MDSQAAWLALFDETFWGKPEGAGGTWFVEKKEALLVLIEGLSAAQASFRAAPTVSSVAAHARHTAYYLHVANQELSGTPEKADWDGSWAVQEVDEAAWSEIKENLATEFRSLRAKIADPSFEPADAEYQVYVWANIAHAAFHLGAIRQLALLASSAG